MESTSTSTSTMTATAAAEGARHALEGGTSVSVVAEEEATGGSGSGSGNTDGDDNGRGKRGRTVAAATATAAAGGWEDRRDGGNGEGGRGGGEGGCSSSRRRRRLGRNDGEGGETTTGAAVVGAMGMTNGSPSIEESPSIPPTGDGVGGGGVPTLTVRPPRRRPGGRGGNADGVSAVSSPLVPYGDFRRLYDEWQVAHIPDALGLVGDDGDGGDNGGGGVGGRSRTADGREDDDDGGGGGGVDDDDLGPGHLHRRDGGSGGDDPTFSWRDVSGLFASLNESDRASWCVETYCGGGGPSPAADGAATVSSGIADEAPGSFLDPTIDGDASGVRTGGYCSFLVQADPSGLGETLRLLPLEHLPVASSSSSSSATTGDEDEERDRDRYRGVMEVRYGPCLWFFFGRNPPSTPAAHRPSSQEPSDDSSLEGRPEHTDSVSHDGTWHYQLSGTKVWHLRPTEELLDRWRRERGRSGEEMCGQSKEDARGENDDAAAAAAAADSSGDDDDDEETESKPRFTVTCNEGDVLLVNTRLWWHRTTLPPSSVPSVSYARDVYLPAPDGRPGPLESVGKKEGRGSQAKNDGDGDDGPVTMTNVDGLYAARPVPRGTVLFTSDDMPDCELHRSSVDPNCEVVELDDERMAVVSRRDVRAGEFFCVAESSSSEGEVEDEDGDEFEEGEEEEWEEGGGDSDEEFDGEEEEQDGGA